MQVAIIGAGITGASCAWALRRALGGGLRLTVFEMGRGAGGRAATRGTRELPGLGISHGAPVFHISLPEAQELTELLEQRGAVERWAGTVGRVLADGATEAGGAASRGAAEGQPVYAGVPGMSAVANGILKAAEPFELKTNTTVSRLQRTTQGVELLDSNGATLGQFDWVVVTSLTAAHPRWTDVFGTPIPLAGVAEGSAPLQEAMASCAKAESEPVQVAMAAWEGDGILAGLPFDVTYLDNPVVSKVVRGVSGGFSTVAVHSTAEFARQHINTHGSTGTVARVAAPGAQSRTGLPESVVLEALFSAFLAAAKPFLGAGLPEPRFGPHLHRWSSAFPGTALPGPVAADGVCLTGDFVGEPTGSVEAAMRGGVMGARALLATCEANL